MILTWLLGGGKWAESPGCTFAYAQLAKNWLLGSVTRGRSPLAPCLPTPHSLKIDCLVGTRGQSPLAVRLPTPSSLNIGCSVGTRGRSPLTARLPMPHSLKIGCLLGTKPPGPTHADAPLAKNWLLGGDKGAESPGCKHPSKNPRSHMTGSQWPKPQKILHTATLVLPDIKAS